MKITSIVLLISGILSIIIWPGFLLTAAMAFPWLCLGFGGIAYLFHRVQKLEGKQ